MKRLLLTNFHKHHGGGHTTFLKSIFNSELVRKGFKIAVCAPPSSYLHELALTSGVCFYPCDFESKPLRPLATLKSLGQFKEVLSAFRPHVVHANGAADMTIAILSSLRNRPFKLVRTQHAIRSIPNNMYHRWLYDQVDVYTYVSSQSRDLSLHGNVWGPRQPIVIESGVDLDYFAPYRFDARHSLFLKMELGIREEMVIGSCAGVSSVKRVDLLIRAAHALKDRYRFKVVLLGHFENWAPHKELVARLGVEDRVLFCGLQSDIRPYVFIFDWGVLLSDRNETLSYAAREMMTMGVPLLSSDFSGMPPNVDDGVNGVVCQAGNLDDTILKLEKCLTTPKEERLQMGVNARKKAEQKFSLTAQIEKYLRIYS